MARLDTDTELEILAGDSRKGKETSNYNNLGAIQFKEQQEGESID